MGAVLRNESESPAQKERRGKQQRRDKPGGFVADCSDGRGRRERARRMHFFRAAVMMMSHRRRGWFVIGANDDRNRTMLERRHESRRTQQAQRQQQGKEHCPRRSSGCCGFSHQRSWRAIAMVLLPVSPDRLVMGNFPTGGRSAAERLGPLPVRLSPLPDHRTVRSRAVQVRLR